MLAETQLLRASRAVTAPHCQPLIRSSHHLCSGPPSVCRALNVMHTSLRAHSTYVGDGVARPGHALLQVGGAASHMQYRLLFRQICPDDAPECCVTKEPLKESWLPLVPSCRKEAREGQQRREGRLHWASNSQISGTVVGCCRAEAALGPPSVWQLDPCGGQHSSAGTAADAAQSGTLPQLPLLEVWPTAPLIGP